MDQRAVLDQHIADLNVELDLKIATIARQDGDLAILRGRLEEEEGQRDRLMNNQLAATNAQLAEKEVGLLEAQERTDAANALLLAQEEQCAILEARCAATEARCAATEARCAATEAGCAATEAECVATKAQVEDLRKSASHKMDDDEIIRYNEIAALKKQVEKNVKNLGDWNSLGNKLRDDETIVVCGKRCSKLDCFVMALGGSNDPLIWRSIGCAMPRDGSITVKGVNYSTLQCLIKCVSDDHPYCWSGLGRYLSGDERAEVNGMLMNKKQCFVKALSIYPRYKLVWYNLGMLLGDGETVKVNGATFTNKACFVNAISVDMTLAYKMDLTAFPLSVRARVWWECLKPQNLTDYWGSYDVFDDYVGRSSWVALASNMHDGEVVRIDDKLYTKDEVLEHARSFP